MRLGKSNLISGSNTFEFFLNAKLITLPIINNHWITNYWSWIMFLSTICDIFLNFCLHSPIHCSHECGSHGSLAIHVRNCGFPLLRVLRFVSHCLAFAKMILTLKSRHIWNWKNGRLFKNTKRYIVKKISFIFAFFSS